PTANPIGGAASSETFSIIESSLINSARYASALQRQRPHSTEMFNTSGISRSCNLETPIAIHYMLLDFRSTKSGRRSSETNCESTAEQRCEAMFHPASTAFGNRSRSKSEPWRISFERLSELIR